MEATSVSLLDRLRVPGDQAAWQRLDDLYRPFIRRQLLSDPTLTQDAEDLIQDILCVVVREVPTFERRQRGAFRSWLRKITSNRLQEFFRKRKTYPQSVDPVGLSSPLMQLADNASELSQRWEAEHDQHIVARLLEIMRKEFADSHVKAFMRVTFDKVDARTVGAELGMTEAAVYNVKSRVLKRLREEAVGLLG